MHNVTTEGRLSLAFLRELMGRFRGLGPVMNRATATNKTMATLAKYRERQARLAPAERTASRRLHDEPRVSTGIRGTRRAPVSRGALSSIYLTKPTRRFEAIREYAI